MPRTRKKVIKTVYKDEDDSEADNSVGDFSDSGSEAEIPEYSSSDEDVEADNSSADEFNEKLKKKKNFARSTQVKKPKFAKDFISKINRQSLASEDDTPPVLFSVKDLTDEDKLLPSVLNLSESDSSEDESSKAPSSKKTTAPSSLAQKIESESENESIMDYKDVWAQNVQDNSEEIAKQTFLELEKHKNKIEETKASILNYKGSKALQGSESNVKDLLALGEDVPSPTPSVSQKKRWKARNAKDDTDSEMEDWEEVKDAKIIPQHGIQLIVDFPDAGTSKKKKKLDIEMMMKRKINRVKKEYQVYMHKVHVLCWLGHGIYVSKVLNDEEILAAVLSLVPSKECYPGARVDMKYVEQITTWYKDKLTLKQDKNEGKFRPKAPPLKDILIEQVKSRVVTTKKYLVYIFVSMLRALGLQCRVIFNFVTLPIKPPSSELCSLSTKPKDDKKTAEVKQTNKSEKKTVLSQDKSKKNINKSKSKVKIPQLDGNCDGSSSECDTDNIMQLDGNDDILTARSRRIRVNENVIKSNEDENVSPPKRPRKSPIPKEAKVNSKPEISSVTENAPQRRRRACRKSPDRSNKKSEQSKDAKSNFKNPQGKKTSADHKNEQGELMDIDETNNDEVTFQRKTRTVNKKLSNIVKSETNNSNLSTEVKKRNVPKIIVTDVDLEKSKYFNSDSKPPASKRLSLRRRSQTAVPPTSQHTNKTDDNYKNTKPKIRTESTPGSSVETSQYFKTVAVKPSEIKQAKRLKPTKKEAAEEDKQRVSHRDILAKNKAKPNNDITGDLVKIIKKRVKEAKEDSRRNIVKGKVKQESDEDNDHLPVETPRRRKSESDEDFKPTKISPRPSTSRVTAVKKIDRRVLSSDTEETPTNKCDVWCEIFVEELEQWIAVDVIRAKVHCAEEIYARATHPVCYVVGWDNNSQAKDVTRRYVPHWHTVTRRQRAPPAWWDAALAPWRAADTARAREEDLQLNRVHLEAPLPKSIAEYKNHPLYALKRHLLKFEALYPADAPALGFVRGEAVYARECVHVCRSRDTWLKEAKVVRPAETAYKVVKARPKWDRLSNKLITDKPLEVFGPWQVQEYEPPTAENGVVPRNAYGNVELFKACMLPKGTVHMKLPGLNRVAKKLNIDCAPAMTGFDFNGGWSHPVYDGYVVCKEFHELLTDAWLKDQEDQERREREKIETRVYGNWRRLIKGLHIRERLKDKYGFEDPALVAEKKKKGPRFIAKKK